MNAVELENLPEAGQIYRFKWSDGVTTKASFQSLTNGGLEVMESSLQWAWYPVRAEDGDPYVVGFEVSA